jgi:hypothetical protein
VKKTCFAVLGVMNSHCVVSNCAACSSVCCLLLSSVAAATGARSTAETAMLPYSATWKVPVSLGWCIVLQRVSSATLHTTISGRCQPYFMAIF